jgi:hypothetical protein
MEVLVLGASTVNRFDSRIITATHCYKRNDTHH